MHTRALLQTALFLLLFSLLFSGIAQADLQYFMLDANTGYSSSVADFRARLADRFPASGAELKRVILSVDSPADAVVSLWLHEQFCIPIGKVLQSYQLQKQNGWYAILADLGLSMDSAELNALQATWDAQIASLP